MAPPRSLPRALPLALLLLALVMVLAPHGVVGRARSDPAVPSPGDRPKPIAQLPDYLQVCSRSDPDLDDCVRRAVEHLRPRLATGIPELGVPACEPLRVPALSLDQGRGAVAMRSDYTDIQVWGVPQFQLRSVRIDLARGRVRLRVRFPELRLRCRYRLDGRVLMLPIRGRGDARGNYTDVAASVILNGDELKREGRSHFSINSLSVDLSIGHAAVHLDGLFDNDPELEEAMNLFLNDNWRNVAAEMRPALEQAVADLCMHLARSVFDSFTLEQLLPP